MHEIYVKFNFSQAALRQKTPHKPIAMPSRPSTKRSLSQDIEKQWVAHKRKRLSGVSDLPPEDELPSADVSADVSGDDPLDPGPALLQSLASVSTSAPNLPEANPYPTALPPIMTMSQLSTITPQQEQLSLQEPCVMSVQTVAQYSFIPSQIAACPAQNENSLDNHPSAIDNAVIVLAQPVQPQVQAQPETNNVVTVCSSGPQRESSVIKHTIQVR